MVNENFMYKETSSILHIKSRKLSINLSKNFCLVLLILFYGSQCSKILMDKEVNDSNELPLVINKQLALIMKNMKENNSTQENSKTDITNNAKIISSAQRSISIEFCILIN